MTLAPTRQPEQVEIPDPTELLIKEARQRGRRRRLTVGAVVLAVVVLGMAGSLAAGHQAPAQRVTNSAGPATNVMGAPLCSASALTTKLGRGGGAAGTSYQTFEMINHATVACALSGVPTTQAGLFTGNGQAAVFKPVGPAATVISFSFAKRGGAVVLRHGALASVTFGMQTAANYVPAQCQAAPVNVVRVVFRSGTSSTTLYYRILRDTVCTRLASTEIAGVVLGTRFP